MRVCVDIQPAIAQQAGVGRYTRMLASGLGAEAGKDQLAFFYFDFRRKGRPFETPHALQKRVTWCPGRAVQAAWRTVGWPPFDRLAGTADVYHFPNFIIPPLKRGKAVVTIHDMSFLRFPEFAENRNLNYLTARIRDTVGRADAIITDSRFSASEIQDLLDVPQHRLFPIHLGIDKRFGGPLPGPGRAGLDPRWKIDRPYLLTVGTLEPRKNIDFMIEVFERLTLFDGYLVVAGMPGWKCQPILEKMRASTRADDIRYIDYVEDRLLPGLYAGAQAFVLTSHYEGFGFPPLEAMACGTPVVSSRGGSLPEVLGDAAVLIPSFDVDEWVERLEKVLTDSDLRRQLVRNGQSHAACYRWEETIRRTWSVYRELTGAEDGL